MPLPPGIAAARRLITIAGAAVAVVVVVGALVLASKDVGNDCGGGFAAARKPLPSPLLTPAEIEVITRDKTNPYEAGIAKARPIEECRRAGASQLITTGLGAGLLLLPVGGLLGFVYWPRREDLVVTYLDEPAYTPSPQTTSWGGGARSADGPAWGGGARGADRPAWGGRPDPLDRPAPDDQADLDERPAPNGRTAANERPAPNGRIASGGRSNPGARQPLRARPLRGTPEPDNAADDLDDLDETPVDDAPPAPGDRPPSKGTDAWGEWRR